MQNHRHWFSTTDGVSCAFDVVFPHCRARGGCSHATAVQELNGRMQRSTQQVFVGRQKRQVGLGRVSGVAKTAAPVTEVRQHHKRVGWVGHVRQQSGNQAVAKTRPHARNHNGDNCGRNIVLLRTERHERSMHFEQMLVFVLVLGHVCECRAWSLHELVAYFGVYAKQAQRGLVPRKRRHFGRFAEVHMVRRAQDEHAAHACGVPRRIGLCQARAAVSVARMRANEHAGARNHAAGGCKKISNLGRKPSLVACVPASCVCGWSQHFCIFSFCNTGV
ncbi:hypothetical protein EJF18_50710 [Clavispora lusitaniae]|uniref:Uncharacterized protein n=1 Tax=Clavispora lusitaniae TaxID=36911 RepID=A0ACD0WR30_CLALS|nr:hypothetical protein EJF14_50710 [Clavispora lusitaniae]QFZ35130.1 hypothetical protein EJF16_50710 [Clavispora lusitaniae]QFZ40815.1 hypothetical protein EJF15_50710 [Clavispora lusitaniae]QFZ46495.1 hypothetical protein EJF18_50710 [Clavispora lusitaniae]QFZ52157.1 hypothetical protein EJF17_50710 [Clavispora lusitaniae]